MNVHKSNASIDDRVYDVVVVGCGPSGATLANLLTQQGIKTLVIDKEPELYDLPRAVHFDDETMRVFQSAGISAELQGKVRANPGMRFVDEEGNILLDWPRPGGVGRHGWHASYRLHQPDLEKLLRNTLSDNQYCSLCLGAELVAISQKDNSVIVTYRNIASSDIQSVNTKYVVGCDGGNSTVRKQLHIGMEDLGFRERWLVVDVLLNHDMPELGDYTMQYCSVSQAMTYCRNPGLRRRWEMALPTGLSDVQACDSSQIWSLLSRWINKDNATLERKAVYTFKSQLAHHWRDHRVFVAGDAAHLTPPFMGQGMCAGIRDAANLSWKLVSCIKNEHDESLLDSYQDERYEHVREYIETAIGLGKLMGTMDKHDVVSIEDGHTQNNSISTQPSESSSVQPSMQPSMKKMASLEPKLGSSTCFSHRLNLSEHAGRIFGQPNLTDGTRLDDYCGHQPILIISSAAVLDDVGLSKENSVLVLHANEHPLLREELDRYQVLAVLLRPDRYIHATANVSTDVAALVSMAMSHKLAC